MWGHWEIFFVTDHVLLSFCDTKRSLKVGNAPYGTIYLVVNVSGLETAGGISKLTPPPGQGRSRLVQSSKCFLTKPWVSSPAMGLIR
jgi:hypothetical protein